MTAPAASRTPLPASPDGIELVRIVTCPDGHRIRIAPAVWEDPAAWGILLADLLRHIASVESERRTDLSSEAFLERLFEGFHAELGLADARVTPGGTPKPPNS